MDFDKQFEYELRVEKMRLAMGQDDYTPNIKHLLHALLERAALDAANIGESGFGPQDVRNARAWIEHWKLSDQETPFSFPWVCLHLELCPYETSRKMLKLIDEKGIATKSKMALENCYMFSLAAPIDEASYW